MYRIYSKAVYRSRRNSNNSAENRGFQFSGGNDLSIRGYGQNWPEIVAVGQRAWGGRRVEIRDPGTPCRRCNEMQRNATLFRFSIQGQASLPAMSCPRAGASCRSGLARSRFCPSASVEPNCQRTNRPSPDVIRGDDRKLFPEPVIIHINDFLSIGAERIFRFFLAWMPRKCHKSSGGKGLRRVEKPALPGFRRAVHFGVRAAPEVVGQYTSCGLL